MLIYLYGPDSYRRQQKLKEYLDRYTKKYSALTVAKFYFDNEADQTRFKDFAEAQSLFGGTKFGILHHPELAGPEIIGCLKTLLDSPTIHLIVMAEEKLNKDFAFLAKSPAITHVFEKLSGDDLAGFITKEAALRGLKLSPSETAALAKMHDGDTWGAATELDILALGGPLRRQAAAENIFALIQQLKSGASTKKITVLTKLLESEEPAAVFNVLASIADPLLKNKMADYDATIKSGKLDYEEALLDCILYYSNATSLTGISDSSVGKVK